MPIPDFQSLMLPVLKLFGDGVENVAECLPHLQTQFALSDEEAQELVPSGSMTILKNRTHWARTYLSKAGLLTSPQRNQHVITVLGRAVLAQNPARIDKAFLAQFDDYADWREHAFAETAPRPNPPRTTPKPPKTRWTAPIG